VNANQKKKKDHLKDQNIEKSYNQDTITLLAYMTLHAQVCGTYKPYLETLLYVINFLFDPRIENGTFKKQQLENKGCVLSR
jgi:hypothetical protein